MQVSITKRIDTLDGRRFCSVILGARGRVKPDLVLVNNHQEKHLEGAYYLDWTEDESVGACPSEPTQPLRTTAETGSKRSGKRLPRGLRSPIPSRMIPTFAFELLPRISSKTFNSPCRERPGWGTGAACSV